MTYDFDTIIPREGTQAVKLEMLGTYFGDKDLLPLWVADMDFATPDFVLEAIRARAEHPILGYTLRSEGFHQAFLGWLEQRHQWRAEREWIRFSPGVVPGLALAVQAFTQPGDKVLVQPPVYPPFFGVVENQGRQLLENPLREEGGRYHMDFDDLERKAAQGAKMLLLCSPQNPGGNVWRPDELERLAQVCQRHGLLVVADEVHADLVFPGFRHTPYPSLGEAAAQHSITFMAPSKTFNCAGLGTSLAIIPNPEIRAAYDKHLHNAHLHFGNIFGSVGTQAAYEQGGPWLDQLMDYLLGNLDFAEAFEHHLIEPTIFQDAYNHQDPSQRKKWREAIKKEFRDMTRLGVWRKVKCSSIPQGR